MINTFCGFILKVHDLERCRSFYRDILQLGQPISDSNFRTEFALGNDNRLILCKASGANLPKNEERSAIWFEPDDPTLQMELLTSSGYLPCGDALSVLLPDTKCFQDPEGNLVYITLKPKKAN